MAQLLSHSAGLTRDGEDTGQWQDRRPFLSEDELRAALAEPPVLDANTRFKYSNHGYGLFGLIIEAASGEDYASFVTRAIVKPAGLEETTPDVPLAARRDTGRGHSGKLPLGRRVVIPGKNSTHALAAATGFVSTARDLVRFFGQLSPHAKRSVLTPESRREMVRKQWRDPQLSVERYYGLGLMSGKLAEWDWFGHSGRFPGLHHAHARPPAARTSPSRCSPTRLTASRISGSKASSTSCVPLRAMARPSASSPPGTGAGGAFGARFDLVPMGGKVMVATPGMFNPFLDASEITVIGKDRAKITQAIGGGSHGQRRAPGARQRGRGLRTLVRRHQALAGGRGRARDARALREWRRAGRATSTHEARLAALRLGQAARRALHGSSAPPPASLSIASISASEKPR